MTTISSALRTLQPAQQLKKLIPSSFSSRMKLKLVQRLLAKDSHGFKTKPIPDGKSYQFERLNYGCVLTVFDKEGQLIQKLHLTESGEIAKAFGPNLINLPVDRQHPQDEELNAFFNFVMPNGSLDRSCVLSQDTRNPWHSAHELVHRSHQGPSALRSAHDLKSPWT